MMDFSDIKMTAAIIKDRPDNHDFNDAIHWQLSLGNNVEVLYSVGIGHYMKQPANGRRYLKEYVDIFRATLLKGRIHNTESPVYGSMYDWILKVATDKVKLNRAFKVQVTPPTIEDVLYSLTMDASAINSNFDHWCADMGYDNDSIKAKATYEACRDSFTKLRALGLNYDELVKHFEDY